MTLKSYLSTLDPAAREALALRCGTTIGHLKNVMYGYRPCSERLAIALERESTGAVTVEALCPDVDWAYLRGTQPAKRRAAG